VGVLDVLDEPVDDGWGEGVVEIDEAGCGWESEFCGVLTEDAGGRGGVSGGLPDAEVVCGGLGEGGVEFDADYFFEGKL
jgi:hypothetical protein